MSDIERRAQNMKDKIEGKDKQVNLLPLLTSITYEMFFKDGAGKIWINDGLAE